MAVVRELLTELKYKLNEAGLREYSRKAKQAGEEVATAGVKAGQAWTQGTQEAAKGLSVLQKRAGALLATYLSFKGARSLLTLVGDLDEAKARLQSTGLAADEYALAHERLSYISKNYTGTLEENMAQFTQFRRVLEGTNISAEDQVKVFEALSAGVSASGGSASQAARVNRRMARSLVDGAVSASTLQTMIDSNYVGFQHLVKGIQETNPELGVTEANIRSLAKEGKLTAEVVVPALTSQLGNLSDAADAVPTTLSGAMTKLRESFKEVISGSEGTSKALDLIVKGITWVSDNIETFMVIGAGFAAVFAASKVVAGLQAISAAISVATAFMTGFSIASAIAFAKILLVVGIIAGLVLLAEDLYTWFTGGESAIGSWLGPIENVKAWFGKVGEEIKALGRKALEFGKELLKLVFFPHRMVLGFLGVDTSIQGLKDTAKSVIDFITGSFDTAIKVITDLLSGNFSEAFDTLKDYFSGILNWIIQRLNSLIQKANKIPGVKIGTISEIPTSSMQRAGRPAAAGSTTSMEDNSQTTINITTNSDNPAAIGRAVERAAGRTSRGLPSVEALP